MESLSFVISGFVILVSISAMVIAFRNYVLIRENFEINKLSGIFIGLCDNFVCPRESFRRKNAGDNPCGVHKGIQFVNYFKDSDIFIKESVYKGDNR